MQYVEWGCIEDSNQEHVLRTKTGRKEIRMCLLVFIHKNYEWKNVFYIVRTKLMSKNGEMLYSTSGKS